MTIQEIEAACDASQPLDLSRHEMEVPELTLRAMFYPSGFPTEVRTNSAEILSQFDDLWGRFESKFSTETIRVNMHLIESDSMECPPTPVFRTMDHTMVYVADSDNYGVLHFGRNESQSVVSRAALRHKLYLRTFFLGVTAWAHIRMRYMTPVHAGCVALDGQAVLLCGDSGAGKSTLSYACARAGWTYITDDGSYLLNHGTGRTVLGSCHKVRFRPSASTLFPEIDGLEVAPYLAGKPSIEMQTASMPNLICAPSAEAKFVVFLNRRTAGPPELVPYRKDVARYFMWHALHASPDSFAAQYQVVERLLTLPILELRYTDLDWAVERLQRLVREGR